MTKPHEHLKPADAASKVTGSSSSHRNDRRRQLLAGECARYGVRFLPAQVMRAIYEREGVL